MVVIYSEKSSLAKEIANVLVGGKRIPLKDAPTVGYYEFKFHGEDAVLCHGIGHLMQLVPAKSYDEKYAHWKLDVFPCIPDTYRIAPKAATIACARLVKELMQKADWCINACDADREGELIFSYVYQACNCHAPYKRAWIEDLTDEKITKAFDNLIEPQQTVSEQFTGTPEQLQKAGRARDIADWLIGNNLTVASSVQYGKIGEPMSVGRVQTPTLALVVQREKAIQNHVKTPFWRLLASFQTAASETFEAECVDGKFDAENEAKAKLSACAASGTVAEIQCKHKTVSAPLLFNATQLQIAANQKFGWEASKTAKIMQELYEAKRMSYPRTSSEHLTESMIPEVTLTIQKILQMPEYAAYALPSEQWQKFSKRHFDDKKVGSHPAIIPTVNVPENLNGLTEEQKQLYDLLCKSLIRMIFPKAELDDTTAIIQAGEVQFKATGSMITKKGWYAVDAMPENKKALPLLKQDDAVSGTYSIKKGETEPPKRYTEADLLAAMELAGQNIEDEELRTLMKMQKKGLGTDATRAPIVKGLFDHGYLARKGKSILPTEKGIFLIDTLPVDEIKSATMTGEWEMRLNNISLGTESFDAFVADIVKTLQNWYTAIAGSPENHFIPSDEKNLICPLCGKPVLHLKFGYGCSGYSKEADGCRFFIGHEIAGAKLSDKDAIALIEHGRTGLIKGFHKKTDAAERFDAFLVLDKNDGRIKFDFQSEAEKSMVCPICGKPMRKTKVGYGCSGYSKDGSGCSFIVYYEIAGKKLTESQVLMLLQNGRTGLIKGFRKKDNPDDTFNAVLKVDKAAKKVTFDYPKK